MMFTDMNPKLMKGQAFGYHSAGLHLAPARISGYQVCASASTGCTTACLYTSGMGKFTTTQAARIAKTKRLFEDADNFLRDIVKDIEAAVRKAARVQLTPAVRLNLTSDVRWELIEVTVRGVTYPNLMAAFPTVQFYDYTKHTNRKNIPANYHLTFSRSESNDTKLADMMAEGYNVAVVFDTKKGAPLPAMWKGIPVIDGDISDLRFLDPRGVIVGLRGKGEARKGSHNGFVISTKTT